MIGTLRAVLGEKVSVNQTVLEAHGRDENYPHTQLPLAVVFAESVADVQATLAWAREHHTPVIPFRENRLFVERYLRLPALTRAPAGLPFS